MRMLQLLAALLAVLFFFMVGCEAAPKKPEACPKEYAHTLPHCKKPRPRVQPDCIPIIQDGKQVGCISRDGLWREIQVQGPRFYPPVITR